MADTMRKGGRGMTAIITASMWLLFVPDVAAGQPTVCSLDLRPLASFPV